MSLKPERLEPAAPRWSRSTIDTRDDDAVVADGPFDDALDESLDDALDETALADAGDPADDDARLGVGLAEGADDTCTAEEERALIEAARRGVERARERLVRLCRRSVVWTARRYRHSGVPLDDLVSEGMTGVLTAIDRFDLARGVRFDTYSRWWVLDAMRNCVLRQSRVVRLPANVIKEIGVMERELKAIEGAGVDTPPRTVVERVARRLRRSSDHVEHLMSLREPVVSIDVELPAATAAPDDEGAASAEAIATVAQLRERMLELMGGLDERERHVLRGRYGLDTGAPATLTEVATELGLTAERVRQIQRDALVKLRRAFVEHGMLEADPRDTAARAPAR